jgi:tetratricopeptide (TPR) repeat protein
LTFDLNNIDETVRSIPGAAYYLALIHLQSDRHDEMEQLLRASWQGAAEPWRRRSLVRLLDYLLEHERYSDIIELVDLGDAFYADDIEISSYRLESLYREGHYAQLIDRLHRYESHTLGPSDTVVGRWVPGVDAALWRAVASYELATDDWPDHFYAAFAQHRASAHHSRLFLFAVAQGSMLSRFDRAQSLLIEARYHLADGRTAQSARLFRAMIEHRRGNLMDMNDLLGPAVLPDIGRAFLAGGDWRLSITAIERLITAAGQHPEPTGAGTSTLARLYEYYGRLQRSSGNRQAAFAAFDRSISMDTPGPDRDRVYWYTLQSAIDADPVTAIRFLEQQGAGFHNPRTFSGLLDTLASRLVQKNDWQQLLGALEAIEPFATPGSLAQYQVINATAMRFGLLGTPDSTERADRLLEQAYSQWENPYYALVAAVMLNRGSELIEARPPPAGNPRSGPEVDPPDIRAYVSGYFRFGLDGQGYLEARQNAGSLTSDTLSRYAATLGQTGNYIDSMRLMDIVARRESRVPALNRAELMYPRAFSREMGEVIRTEALEPEIFYALVREESYFSASISSHVGAIGLSQLMPSTAADVARAMRLQNPNLTDPSTNLSIGARYLRGLINRFGSLQHALLGYNAGPTRVRRWNSENGALPPVLFQEAVPFLETRHYIRKIFVTAVQYGRLYGEMTPQQVFDVLFSAP